MAMEPTHPTGLSAETRAVIGAVLEALAIPHAATVAHDETRANILMDRVTHVTVAAQLIAERDDPEHLTDTLAWLRERLDPNPAAGYVTAEQARARCDAGAGWMQAVRLDYTGPAADVAEDEQPAGEGSEGEGSEGEGSEGEAAAGKSATWPNGEPASVRQAADDQDDEQAAIASLGVRLLAHADSYAPLIAEFAEDGETELATAFASVALAFRLVVDTLGDPVRNAEALDRLAAANTRARLALAAARARQAEDPTETDGR